MTQNRISAINYDALPDAMQRHICRGIAKFSPPPRVYIKLRATGQGGWMYEYVTEQERDQGMCLFLESRGWVCVLGIPKETQG